MLSLGSLDSFDKPVNAIKMIIKILWEHILMQKIDAQIPAKFTPSRYINMQAQYHPAISSALENVAAPGFTFFF